MTITPFCMIASALVGIGILVANPRRLASQAFAALSLLGTLWFLLVLATQYANDPVRWARANAAVAALAPWATWVVMLAIVNPNATHSFVLRQSRPWLTLIALEFPLCFADRFVWKDNLSGTIEHGAPYWIHCSIGLLAYTFVAHLAIKEMQRQRGIRKIEIQFLVLNLQVCAFLCLALLALGNLIHVSAIKTAGLVVLGVAYLITAWGLAAHHIFELRQVCTSIAQVTATALVLVLVMLAALNAIGARLPFPADILLGAVASGFAAIWFHRKSRNWTGLDGERALASLRKKVIEFARTEPQTSNLVVQFKELLSQSTGGHTAILMFSESENFGANGFELSKTSRGYHVLVHEGWSTPEMLHRRRPDTGLIDLREFLDTNRLGLIISVPKGSHDPSLLIALGTKANELPFTYPEIQRLQNVAELMDNILTRSRLTAEAALKAKLDHLALMSRGLAHDLKNLITPMSSFLVHTEGQFAADSPAAEVHAEARRSVRIMTDYVREALFFANRLEPKFESAAVSKILHGLRELMAARAEKRGVTLAFALENDQAITVDEVLVQRMLGNIVANAIDASRSGQVVTITARTGRPGWVQFEVRDDGCGIEAADLGRIFEPYFTTKEFGHDVRGFGLGLTVSQKIADLHRGTINVRSTIGRGTTFTVEIPASPSVPVALEPLQPADATAILEETDALAP